MSADAPLFDRVLAHFDGSPTKFARAVNESVPAVCNWRMRGIPAHRARMVAKLTGISLQELRPKDWHLYWPEAGAAQAGQQEVRDAA